VITITIAQWIITKLELRCYGGDWYLLRAKFIEIIQSFWFVRLDEEEVWSYQTSDRFG